MPSFDPVGVSVVENDVLRFGVAKCGGRQWQSDTANSRFEASNEPPKRDASEVPLRVRSPNPSKGSRKPQRLASIQFGKSSSEREVAYHQKADTMVSSDHSQRKLKKSSKRNKGSKREQQQDEFMELNHSNHKLIRKTGREKSKLSAQRTKSIDEETTVVAASAMKDIAHGTTATQDEGDKYRYGYTCPDKGSAKAIAPMATRTEGLVPTLMVGAGKAPGRSSLKNSSEHGPPRRRRSSLIHVQQHESTQSDGFRSMKKGSSIQFADYDEVQEVEPAKNLTWENSDLWYQPEEIRVINQHNRYMVDVAKSGAVTDRKICIRGLETFLIPLAERKARKNKLYDSIKMIQDHERQHGVLDEDLMSRVCRHFSDEDAEVATTRALEDAVDTQKYMTKKSRRPGRRLSCCV